VPIAKFGLEEFKNYENGDSRIWLFEGSRILSSHNGLAVAINTGYSSKRGRILRKMLIRNIEQPHFFKSYIYFVLFSYIIGVIAYLATLSLRLNMSNGGIDRIFILLNFLLIITFCFPPAAAIYFNLVYSFSLIRLKFNGILGT
jgi:magnesium-transporting ATPase (P-type)